METLEQLKSKFQQIASDWNGEDSNFVSGGIAYKEDDAQLAKDILDQIESLEEMIKSFEF